MFAPCSSCRRHVRVGDASCPFCGASASGISVSDAPVETARRARTWLAAAAIGGALAGAACAREPRSVALYGAPPEPTVTSEPTATQAPPPIEPIPPPPPTATGTAPGEPPPAPPPSAQPIPPSPTGQPPMKPIPGPPIALYGAPPPPPTN